MSDTIPVSKKTLTYADTLVAVGWASLLRNCLGGNITIRNCGDHFDVIAVSSFSPQDFEGHKIGPGYDYILDKSDKGNKPAGSFFDYETERKKAQIYRQYQKDIKSAKKKGQVNKVLQETGGSEPVPPNSELQVLTILSSMRKGFRGDKDIHQLVEKNSACMGSIVAKRITYYRGVDSSLAEEEKIFKGNISNSQFFNPITGKGVIRPKPDGTTLASYPKKEVDWFEEWLKFRGMYDALLAYRSGDDLKIYVIEPQDIPIYVLEGLRKKLLGKNLWGGIKLDIQAVLSLVKILISHSKEYDPDAGMLSFLGRRPKEVISGLHLAYFKSLGTAAALMNYSFLGLPGWFEIHNHETAAAFLEIIDEHIGDRNQRKMGCLGSLQENNSGDVPLLTQYRSFLSSGNLMTFLEFLAMFATHIIQQREQKQPVKQFSTNNLRRLFVMGYDLQHIVGNDGFLNIATAIRKATVNAQYRKVSGTQVWDIRYGLAQEWKRQVKYPDRFVIALSEFVQQYNAENARHAEQGKERRKNISTEDLNQVLKLIRDNGAELVGMLLLAYGYAKEPKEDSIQD